MTSAPETIIAEECARHGVDEAGMRGGRQRGAPLKARQAVAYRLWMETDMSADAVAAHIGRSDHAAAAYAILAHARHVGRPAARISDLRDGGAIADLDWTKLAFAAAGWREGAAHDIRAAAKRAGIGRGEWRKAEKGCAVGAGTVLRICRTIGIDPFLLVSPDASAAAPPAGLRPEGADARPAPDSDPGSRFARPIEGCPQKADRPSAPLRGSARGGIAAGQARDGQKASHETAGKHD